MYCDSYNSVNHPLLGDFKESYKIGNFYKIKKPYYNDYYNFNGYAYTLNGNQSKITNSDFETGINTIDTINYSLMYSDLGLLASASCNDTTEFAYQGSEYMCTVSQSCLGYEHVVNLNYRKSFKLKPIVSLSYNVQLKIKWFFK